MMKRSLMLLALAGVAAGTHLRSSNGKTNCMAFFDQGGGSFTGFLYSSPTKKVAKCKSKDMLKAKGQEIKYVTKGKGTFTDYSQEDSDKFGEITGMLAGLYKEGINSMKEEEKARDCTITKLMIRQTGKIREALLTGARTGEETKWVTTMKKSLKDHVLDHFKEITDVDYALLSNAEEAEMEGTDFFDVQWAAFNEVINKDEPIITKDKVIAAGIGSSSTQVYTMVENKVKAIGDSSLGALPAKGMNKDNMPDFNLMFANLIPLSFEPNGKTFVAMNAVGYAVKTCYDKAKDATKWEKLKEAVIGKKPITAEKLKEFGEECWRKAGENDFAVYYPGKLLHALAVNLKLKNIKDVLLECKFPDESSIPGGSSWATYLISKNFPAAKGKKMTNVQKMAANIDNGEGEKNKEQAKKFSQQPSLQQALKQ